MYDAHHTGRITSALQLFGNVTFLLFWDNGYQALRALDDDGDGALRGHELDGLALWHDVNHNGVSDAREVRALSEWHIVALSTRHEVDTENAAYLASSSAGVTFADGSTRPTYDILLRARRPGWWSPGENSPSECRRLCEESAPAHLLGT